MRVLHPLLVIRGSELVHVLHPLLVIRGSELVHVLEPNRVRCNPVAVC
jgi:hypothetical protein